MRRFLRTQECGRLVIEQEGLEALEEFVGHDKVCVQRSRACSVDLHKGRGKLNIKSTTSLIAEDGDSVERHVHFE